MGDKGGGESGARCQVGPKDASSRPSPPQKPSTTDMDSNHLKRQRRSDPLCQETSGDGDEEKMKHDIAEKVAGLLWLLGLDIKATEINLKSNKQPNCFNNAGYWKFASKDGEKGKKVAEWLKTNGGYRIHYLNKNTDIEKEVMYIVPVQNQYLAAQYLFLNAVCKTYNSPNIGFGSDRLLKI